MFGKAVIAQMMCLLNYVSNIQNFQGYRIGLEAAYRELLKYDIHKVNREENRWKA